MIHRLLLLCCLALGLPVSAASAQLAAPGMEVLHFQQGPAPPLEEVEAAPQTLGKLPPGTQLRPLLPAVPSPPAPLRQVADEEEVTPSVELSPPLRRLRTKVLRVLSYHLHKPTYTTQHSPWGIMHAMHGFGVETEVSTGSQQVNAAGWLCWNKPCRGRTMMYVTPAGKLDLRIGPGYQGHEGQFLALLAQARVSSDFGLRVDGREFTIEDLIAHEQQTCKPGTELTFKLIGLSHYLGAEAKWTNRHGRWTVPRLIEEELRQPVVGAACGGTHRLMGHSYALARARKAQVPIEGAWSRCSQYVLNYQRRAIMLRNGDGSFSTNWFEGRGMSNDIDRRLQTSGHILEWMVFSLPQVDLTDSRIVKSVDYLATLMLNHRGHQWEIGPRGHAIRALALYDQRVFGGQPGQLERRLAELVPGHPLR